LLSLNKVGVQAPWTSLDELMLDYLAFDAAGAAGTAPGGTSGEQAFLACACVSTYTHFDSCETMYLVAYVLT
jgi:hypothetical protein